jgi:RNA polymerase sigma factor (sigma-70 family)
MDASTIYQLRCGSEGVFEQVYYEYHKKLYYYFLKKTKSAAISEDLVQETFIKLWRYRDRLDTELLLPIQLFQMAKTIMIDLLRKNARSRVSSVPSGDIALLAEVGALIQSEPVESPPVLSQVRETLSQLSPMRRKIIEQRLEGFSNQEIAMNLSISQKTVENQINKAFHDIRRHVGIPLTFLVLIARVIG